MMIPKFFYIFSEKIKVSFLKKIKHAEGESYGVWIENENRIKLARTLFNKPLTKEQMEQTYFHEVTHAILDSIGEPELSNNEILVDKFSKALYQVLKSSEYGTKGK